MFPLRALILFVTLCLPAFGFSAGEQPVVKISNVEVNKRGGSIRVGFDAAADRHTVGTNHKLIVQPYLYLGADTMLLEPFTVTGRNKIRREKQVSLLTHTMLPATQEVPQGGSLHYTASLPWSGQARDWTLGLAQSVEGCCSQKPVGDYAVARGKFPVLVLEAPQVSVVRPEPRMKVSDIPQKWIFRDGELAIDFIVARTEIVPTLFYNNATLTQILMAVDSIRRNPMTSLNKIEITGYASPEGTIAHNRELGYNRAMALKNYIQEHFRDIPDSDFIINNGEENWDGLRRMVASSDMKYRDQVLAFIDNTPLVDSLNRSRNSLLKKLHDGEPYRYMLQYFYPRLRNTCYIAVYYSPMADPAADAINAATRMIGQKDYAGALQSLRAVSSDPRSWNALGVCLIMTGDEKGAREWFEKAVATGDQDARANLEQLSAL